jgi:hypothetical protein
MPWKRQSPRRAGRGAENLASAETGGGLVNALPLLSRVILLVNSDVFPTWISRLQIAPGDLAQLVLVANPAHQAQGFLAGPGPNR